MQRGAGSQNGARKWILLSACVDCILLHSVLAHVLLFTLPCVLPIASRFDECALVLRVGLLLQTIKTTNPEKTLIGQTKQSSIQGHAAVQPARQSEEKLHKMLDDPPTTAAPAAEPPESPKEATAAATTAAAPTAKPADEQDDIALLRQLHREINGLTRRTKSKTALDPARPRKRSKPADHTKTQKHPERTLSEAGSASDGDPPMQPKGSVTSGTLLLPRQWWTPVYTRLTLRRPELRSPSARPRPCVCRSIHIRR